MYSTCTCIIFATEGAGSIPAQLSFFFFFVTQAHLHIAFHFTIILYYTCTCFDSIYFHLFCPSSIHIILSTDYFLNASMDKNVVLFIHFVNLMEGLYKITHLFTHLLFPFITISHISHSCS